MDESLGKASQLPKMTTLKSAGKVPSKLSLIDPNPLKSELDSYKRDIEEKDKLIKTLSAKVDDYTKCCVQIHDFILEMEKVIGRSFFSDEQRSKDILITYTDYSKMLKESLSALVQVNSGLQDRFSNSFIEKATKISEEITRVRDDILSVEQKKKDINKEIAKYVRLADIHQKEKESLHRILANIESQIKQQDVQANIKVNNIKDQIDQIELDINSLTQETVTLDKKYKKMMEQPKNSRMINTEHDDFIREREILALTRKYEQDCAVYESDFQEYTHIISELKRGRQLLEIHKRALTRDRINAAEKLNHELRLYLENERVSDAKKLDAQIRKNRELERQLNTTKEELATLKPYLQQLEKKYINQTSQLPLLNYNVEQNSLTTNPIQKANVQDDNEVTKVKKTVSKINRKKSMSKSYLASKSALK